MTTYYRFKLGQLDRPYDWFRWVRTYWRTPWFHRCAFKASRAQHSGHVRMEMVCPIREHRSAYDREGFELTSEDILDVMEPIE